MGKDKLLTFRERHELLIASIYVCISCCMIMVLLQPFGLDRVERYKYPIIIGYGVMAAVAYVLVELFTTYVLKMPRRKRWENKRGMIVAIMMCPIMGAFISSYAGLVYGGSIAKGWFNHTGELELSAFIR